jgi:hypothetical protein
LHTLRKEYGSQVCAQFGIHAASRALRHADIGVTAQFYTDSRARISSGLGHLLAPAPENVTPIKGHESSPGSSTPRSSKKK